MGKAIGRRIVLPPCEALWMQSFAVPVKKRLRCRYAPSIFIAERGRAGEHADIGHLYALEGVERASKGGI